MRITEVDETTVNIEITVSRQAFIKIEKLSAILNRSIPELLTFGLSLAETALTSAADGSKLVIQKKSGEVKEIRLPSL